MNMLPTMRSRATPAAILLCMLAGVVIAFLLSELLRFGYGQDQGVFATVASVMLRGGLPYRDAWDIKPPGIYFIFTFAKWLFGDALLSIRLVEATGLLTLCTAVFVISRQHIGAWQPGVLAAVFAVLGYVRLDYYWTAQAEGFAGFAIAWAIMLAAIDWSPETEMWKKRLAWSCSGLLYGSTIVLKPQLGMGALVSVLIIIWREVKQNNVGQRNAILWPGLTFFMGLTIVPMLTFTWMWASGILPDAHGILGVWVPNYTRVTLTDASLYSILIKPYLQWIFASGEAYTFVALVVLFLLAPCSRREREGIVHLFGAVFFQLLGVGLQAKFFAYHYAGATPFLGVLAAWGFWKAALWLSAHCKRLSATAAVLIMFSGGILITTVVEHKASFVRNTLNRIRLREAGDRRTQKQVDMAVSRYVQEVEETAEFIKRSTPAGAPIFLWGMETTIYELSKRRNASRYIMNAAQRVAWSAENERWRLMGDLRATSVSAIIIQRYDAMRPIMGNREDSASALNTFPELKQYIEDGYTTAAELMYFDILLAKQQTALKKTALRP